MNDDVSKSFPCNEIGCQMSFYTEQNLSAHRQVKHNKLNLEIPPKDATINFCEYEKKMRKGRQKNLKVKR